MQPLDVSKLILWHRTRDLTGAGMADKTRQHLQAGTFFISTCMREIAVTLSHAGLHPSAESGLQCLRGKAAYAFLLRTVTGLNSSIPGETNIQGQMRKAWEGWRHVAGIDAIAALDPLMHRLFADGRSVRRRYLQGIGGHSYGSLARKLLNPDSNAHILLIGAGELACSVAPFFRGYRSALWNRHATDAGAVGMDFAFSPQAIAEAAAWATHVILTTPPHVDNDLRWAKQLRTSRQLEGVVHLGLRRACRNSWQGFSACHDLDDVIDFRRSQTSLRSMRIAQARAACEAIAAACCAGTPDIGSRFIDAA